MELQNHVSPSTPLPTDWEQWMGNWVWRAVQCLVELPEFNPSPKWVAQRLNISVEKSVEAIEGLERLGAIRRHGSGFKVATPWMQVGTESLQRPQLLSAHGRIAPQLMSKLSAQDSFSSQFFLGSRALVKKYGPLFMELFKKMNDEGQNLQDKEVMAAQISFVQVTADAKAGGAQ